MIVLRTIHIMDLVFVGVILTLLCLGVSGSHTAHWFPCEFVDEKVYVNKNNHTETQYIHKEAVIQFGNAGDSPLYPAITFLVTASKVDMRLYVDSEDGKLCCEIRRYSTKSTVMRWPAMGAQDYDIWFTCTLRSTKGLFNITTFLRHTPAAPTKGRPDYLHWITIKEGELLTTSAAMVVLTRTPSVEVGFLKETTLHCQFAVDHKLANVSVEWTLQRHGERSKLFSYFSRTGKSEGSGVSVKAIGAGNASFKLRPIRKNNEGTYTCSVLIPPLHGSHNIPLSLSEKPRVSLNVGSSLALTLGEDQKVVCDAEGYYPLDVNIEWYRGPAGGSLTPVFLKNVLHSSHQLHQDGTYSLSAFFLLQPGLEDSGYKYTCRVSHKSLLTPIRKSFILTVTEPDSTMWYIKVFGFIIVMLGILNWLLPQYLAGRKAANKRF
ncbi:tapasin-related protein-like [Myxocyprinus asiaticus]|uniref:tapasin-related protein-like n=1 Tax=Myxocyprinus asiaticus TaxID=70543 RepID=UPI0022223106|nr:tapasin-related protein-like [Myxocyprinus asiaticus]